MLYIHTYVYTDGELNLHTQIKNVIPNILIVLAQRLFTSGTLEHWLKLGAENDHYRLRRHYEYGNGTGVCQWQVNSGIFGYKIQQQKLLVSEA